MFEACMTYESGISDNEDFPVTSDPVWILGKKYDVRTQLKELQADFRTRLWFTYRKFFSQIGGTGFESDCGWGCMLRCGQMVMGQALLCRHLGRDWIWHPKTSNVIYHRIIRLFQDKKSAPYSIHQIAQMGVSEGKAVGQWFGPNTVAQVLRKLAVYDDWSSIVVHVAMDNTVVIKDIKNLCKTPRQSNPLVNGSSSDDMYSTTRKSHYWRPLLLFIPLRVGLSEMNPIYTEGLKTCFTLRQSLGIIGGKPNHAFYFIGYTGKQLIFLDPHTTQIFACFECQNSDCKGTADDSTFHCSHSSRMDIMQLDPSIAICFYCDTESDFDDLCHSIQKLIIDKEKQPLFEINKERPAHWPSYEAALDHASDGPCSSDFTLLETDRKFDTSDDEFELLG